ncbi:MAG: HEPN domain-containing protein [Nitrososphaeria archaeon]
MNQKASIYYQTFLLYSILWWKEVDWLKNAKRDLENTEYEIKGGFYGYAFFSSIASEKAVKAVFPKISA